MSSLPLIDSRTGEEIVTQGKALATEYTPDWIPREGDRGLAMLSLFGRLMEIVISRLNRVPEKSFLAFLDTAGVSLLPPKAALAPVRFVAVEGAPDDGVAPAGTQIATAPPPGQEAATFETEKDLVVHRALLQHLYTLDPADDTYDDHGDVLSANEKNQSLAFQPFVGTPLIPHRLYIGQDTLFQINHPTTVTLEFTLSAWDAAFESFFRNKLLWKTWDGGEEKEITPPASAVSANATAATITVTFDSSLVTKVAQKQVAAEKEVHSWIWAETAQDLSSTEAAMQVKSIGVRTEAADIPAEAAFFNSLPLDLTRELYPFGDRPKLYDTFFFAVPEVFVRAGSTVTIIPQFTVGVSTASGGATLTWDFWDGTVWGQLGASNSLTASSAGTYAFSDTTMAFTQTVTATGTPAKIEFTCPQMALVEVNGKKNYWLRVRITGGNYGEEAKMELTAAGAAKPPADRRLSDWTYTGASYQPPIIASLRVSYRYGSGQQPTTLRTENDFTIASPTVGFVFSPFVTPGETQPALYFGFDRAFASRPVSLFVAVEESTFTTPPAVVWEYTDGTAWKNLGVQDGTANLTESGTVEFIGPSDASAGDRFGVPAPRFWIRARLETGDKHKIALHGAYLNTTWTRNCTTVRNEPLGSSTETPNAEFTLSRFPVLEGLKIEVREPDRPNEEELGVLRDEEGEDVLQPADQGQASSREYWVRWHRVDDFRFSEKTSRHFTIDWSTGRIRFGDGKKGMIPPAGRDNIRAAWYQSGGGAKGTAARNAITVLKRSIPFVEKAFNVDQAGGGSDAETAASVMVRGPQTIKNRDRAVTWEDYEWLAKEASLQVARATCLPAKTKDEAGTVRLIIVPLSDELQPLPSQGLIRQVKDYLNTRMRRIGTANLSVIGPKYVEVSVQATVFPEKLEEADLVRRRVRENLTAFFHPLSGGPDRTGWEFGRDVYVSEVCKVIEDTEGVHHGEDVALSSAGLGLSGVDYIPVPDDALVASGEHAVAVSVAVETTSGGT
ncbi:MAG TPA: putative baseplate assembly protein [Syntrophobacteria bacterium]|nr:putative baseplate assembly protein [Syntrophobacteria bacterium]